MKRIMMKRPMIKGTKKRITAIATITTLLSATAAFVAIKAKKARTAKREEKSNLEIVLDGLVESGTITQAQEVAIQSAITTAIEAGAVDVDFTRDDNGEFENVPDSTKIGTLSKIKKSLFEVPQIKEEHI